MVNLIDKNILVYILWLLATVSTLGSLFFSEIMLFPPCVLCWYQRIAMYPLVVIFLVAAITSGREFFNYSFPLAVIGWFIALYHNLLSKGIIPESASPCVQGVSCSTVYIEWLGFITIPLLSFVSFSLILMVLVFYKRVK